MAWNKNFCDSKNTDSNITVAQMPQREMKMRCENCVEFFENGSNDNEATDVQDTKMLMESLSKTVP